MRQLGIFSDAFVGVHHPLDMSTKFRLGACPQNIPLAKSLAEACRYLASAAQESQNGDDDKKRGGTGSNPSVVGQDRCE